MIGWRRRTGPWPGSIARTQRNRSGNLILEDDIEEGAVHVQPAVVLNEAQVAELVQKETDAGARRADHLSQRVLTDLPNDRLRLAFFPKIGHEQQHPCKPLLTGIEELIHQVLLDAKVTSQKMREK